MVTVPRSGVLADADVVVVGAGIVGLAHAVEARRLGRSVVVIERDDVAVGASIRNFGHACVTAQAGVALDRATRARARWLELAGTVGFWAAEAGTVVVARAEDELAVLEEFAAGRHGTVEVLDAAGVRVHLPTAPADVVGGAFFPLDLRVNPREAVRALGAWLGDQDGVTVVRGAMCLGVDDDGVDTNRGRVTGRSVLVCVNHDVDRLFPDLAERAGLVRCRLMMLRVAPAAPVTIRPGVLSGSSLLRYGGFAGCPSLGAVRARFERDHRGIIEADVNLMATQLPDGELLLGDTHVRARTPDPFAPGAWEDLLLDEGSRLLGLGPLRVTERWQGVYAAAPDDFLVASPSPSVRVVSVTTGIGMSTAFGLAEDVVAGL